jgi:hypothetical protein
MNPLRKPSLIQDPYPISLPFDGFKSHKKHPKSEIASSRRAGFAMTIGNKVIASPKGVAIS